MTFIINKYIYVYISNLNLNNIIYNITQVNMAERNNNENRENKNKDYIYKVERVCGNGSFGIVFQGKIIHTGEIIAIKKVYQDKKYKNREYTITKELSHPNIIKLIHAFYTTGEKTDEIYLNIVMNYVSDNLNRLINNYKSNKETFPVFLIKLYTFQVARALNYIHSKHIAHRDIKPQNILIDPSTNRVYLCDFGSAKILREDGKNVAYICSRYYRAPELILLDDDSKYQYTESIDIWSFGCVIAEMILRKPFLEGSSATAQLTKIVEVFGGPKPEDLKDIVTKNDIFEKTRRTKPQSLSKIFNGMPNALIDLLSRIFVYNPNKRLTAMEIMAHSFFDELRNVETSQSGKYIVPNLFDFSKKEIEMSKQKELFKKIIPEWADGYKNIPKH